jgi:1,4-alpha-glucan branching enzyme
MPKKSPAKNGSTAKVTFELREVDAERVHVAGDFNDWSLSDTPLNKRKDGRFSATLTLPAGREYRYRYVLDGDRWTNDTDADRYEPNEHGSEDSVLDLR